MALLEVRDLALEYSTERGPLRAVDRMSFDVEEGEALGIIGESGSGKTSMAISLMRLLPRNGTLDGGSIRLAGGEVEAHAVHGAQRSTIGRVLERQVAYFQQGHQSRLSLGLTMGSMARASSMKVMAVSTMSRPGETTHHQ